MSLTQPSRAELARMLSELSTADALEYVWRPIVYAYYLTDCRDPDRLSDDDFMRAGLIGAAAHGSPDLVSSLDSWRRFVANLELKERVGA